MKHTHIKECFKNLKHLKECGIYFNGATKDTEFKQWHRSGHLGWHCFYKNGKKDGVYKSWHSDGRIYRHQLYKNQGLLKASLKRKYINKCFTDLNTFKSTSIHFSGIRRDSEYKRWNNDGKLASHRFYKNGKINGEYRTYYSNGELYVHLLYKNGQVVKDYLT